MARIWKCTTVRRTYQLDDLNSSGSYYSPGTNPLKEQNMRKSLGVRTLARSPILVEKHDAMRTQTVDMDSQKWQVVLVKAIENVNDLAGGALMSRCGIVIQCMHRTNRKAYSRPKVLPQLRH